MRLSCVSSSIRSGLPAVAARKSRMENAQPVAKLSAQGLRGGDFCSQGRHVVALVADLSL